MHRFVRHAAGLTALIAIAAPGAMAYREFMHPPIPYPDPNRGFVRTASRGSSLDKLSGDLRLLFDQVTHPRRMPNYTAPQLISRFGISYINPSTRVDVAISVTGDDADPAIEAAGASVLRRSGNLICARVSIGSLRALTDITNVTHVRTLNVDRIGPSELEARRPRVHLHLPTRGGSAEYDFDHAGLTGKGVVVGIRLRSELEKAANATKCHATG